MFATRSSLYKLVVKCEVNCWPLLGFFAFVRQCWMPLTTMTFFGVLLFGFSFSGRLEWELRSCFSMFIIALIMFLNDHVYCLWLMGSIELQDFRCVEVQTTQAGENIEPDWNTASHRIQTLCIFILQIGQWHGNGPVSYPPLLPGHERWVLAKPPYIVDYLCLIDLGSDAHTWLWSWLWNNFLSDFDFMACSEAMTASMTRAQRPCRSNPYWFRSWIMRPSLWQLHPMSLQSL